MLSVGIGSVLFIFVFSALSRAPGTRYPLDKSWLNETTSHNPLKDAII